MTLQFKPDARNEKSCLWWSVNLACGGSTCMEKGWDWGN